MPDQTTQINTMTPEQALSQSALLDALLYVANNAQKSPNESVRDMCNEAFDICEIPMMANGFKILLRVLANLEGK